MKAKTAVVLGGETKFGAYLVKHLQAEGCHTLGLGRSSIDFSSGWVTGLKSSLDLAFGDANNVELIVVNVFDARLDYLDTQLNVLSFVWSLFKSNPSVTVVAIGSMEHYYRTSTLAAQAKLKLRDYVFEALQPSQDGANFLLVEPWRLSSTPAPGAMSYEALSKRLVELVDLNVPFMSTAVKDLS